MAPVGIEPEAFLGPASRGIPDSLHTGQELHPVGTFEPILQNWGDVDLGRYLGIFDFRCFRIDE